MSIQESGRVIEDWSIEYNTYRQRSSLGRYTPDGFAGKHMSMFDSKSSSP